MAAVDNLPVELFHAIIPLVSRQDLASWMRVSKSWNRQIAPLLYQDIQIDWITPRRHCMRQWREHPLVCPCEDVEICHSSHHPIEGGKNEQPSCLEDRPTSATETPSLYLFFRTAIASSHLSSHVRSLRLCGAVRPTVWTTPEQTELTNLDVKLARRLIQQGPRLWEESWIVALNRGSPDVFVAVLLLCLLNLELLQLSHGFQLPSNFIGVLLRNSLLIPALRPNLSRLSSADIGMNRDVTLTPGRSPFYHAGDLDQQLSFFYLPSIRSLSLIMPDLYDRRHFSWPVEPPCALGLESLELPFSSLPADKLAYVLDACPKLKILKYDFRGDMPVQKRWGEGTMNLKTLAKTLRRINTTLENFHLHVTIMERDQDPETGELTINHCISFRSFSRLRLLHVPIVALIGPFAHGSKPIATIGQALPKSLEHLCLNDDEVWLPDVSFAQLVPDRNKNPVLVQILRDFLAECEHITPNLKTLTLLMYDIPDAEEPRDREVLEDSLLPLCLAKGLRLTVIISPLRLSWRKGNIQDWRGPFFHLPHFQT